MRQYRRRSALPVFFAIVAGVWGLLFLHHSRQNDPWDLALGILLAAGWTLGVTFQLFETQAWTIRALGVFGGLTVDALIYTYVVGGRWDGRWLTSGQLEGILDLARAFGFVSMPLFIVGVLWTIVQRRRDRRLPDPADDPRATRDAPTGLP